MNSYPSLVLGIRNVSFKGGERVFAEIREDGSKAGWNCTNINNSSISADNCEFSPVPRTRHICEYATSVLKVESGYLQRYAKATPNLDGITQM
jgi:hypothetical protein